MRLYSVQVEEAEARAQAKLENEKKKTEKLYSKCDIIREDFEAALQKPKGKVSVASLKGFDSTICG